MGPYLPQEQNNKYRKCKLKLFQIRKHVCLLGVAQHCSRKNEVQTLLSTLQNSV